MHKEQFNFYWMIILYVVIPSSLLAQRNFQDTSGTHRVNRAEYISVACKLGIFPSQKV